MKCVEIAGGLQIRESKILFVCLFVCFLCYSALLCSNPNLHVQIWTPRTKEGEECSSVDIATCMFKLVFYMKSTASKAEELNSYVSIGFASYPLFLGRRLRIRAVVVLGVSEDLARLMLPYVGVAQAAAQWWCFCMSAQLPFLSATISLSL